MVLVLDSVPEDVEEDRLLDPCLRDPESVGLGDLGASVIVNSQVLQNLLIQGPHIGKH